MSRLSRRSFVAGCSLAAAALSLRLPAHAAARDVYRRAIVIDGLGGLGNSALEGPMTPQHAQDVRDSGLTCVHVTITPVGTTPPDTAFAQTAVRLGYAESEIDAHPEVLTRIRTAADITAAKQSGRTGLVYGLQDGVAFETDFERLDTLYRLGLRVVQPTYNRRNLLGDGARRDGGGLPVRERSQHAAPLRDAGRHAVGTWAFRCADREDPRRQPRPRLLKHLEIGMFNSRKRNVRLFESR